MAEDVPATPGWVEERLDEILPPSKLDARAAPCRVTYLACLANCHGDLDAEVARQDCRAAFLACLRDHGHGELFLAELGTKLEALEAELSERT